MPRRRCSRDCASPGRAPRRRPTPRTRRRRRRRRAPGYTDGGCRSGSRPPAPPPAGPGAPSRSPSPATRGACHRACPRPPTARTRGCPPGPSGSPPPPKKTARASRVSERSRPRRAAASPPAPRAPCDLGAPRTAQKARRCAPRAGVGVARRRRHRARRSRRLGGGGGGGGVLAEPGSVRVRFRVRFRVDLHDVVLRACVRGEVDDHGLVVPGDDRLVVPAADVVQGRALRNLRLQVQARLGVLGRLPLGGGVLGHARVLPPHVRADAHEILGDLDEGDVHVGDAVTWGEGRVVSARRGGKYRAERTQSRSSPFRASARSGRTSGGGGAHGDGCAPSVREGGDRGAALARGRPARGADARAGRVQRRGRRSRHLETFISFAGGGGGGIGRDAGATSGSECGEARGGRYRAERRAEDSSRGS